MSISMCVLYQNNNKKNTFVMEYLIMTLIIIIFIILIMISLIVLYKWSNRKSSISSINAMDLTYHTPTFIPTFTATSPATTAATKLNKNNINNNNINDNKNYDNNNNSNNKLLHNHLYPSSLYNQRISSPIQYYQNEFSAGTISSLIHYPSNLIKIKEKLSSTYEVNLYLGHLYNPSNNIDSINSNNNNNYYYYNNSYNSNTYNNYNFITVGLRVLDDNNVNQVDKDNFINEAINLSSLNHPNITKMIGVCFTQNPMCLIFDYNCTINLKEFLNNFLSSSTSSKKTFLSSSSSLSSTITTPQTAGINTGVTPSTTKPGTPTASLLAALTTESFTSLLSSSLSLSSPSPSSSLLLSGNLLKSKPKLNELLYFAIQIVSGMIYLSSLNYTHRQLNCSNCLIDNQMRIKIITIKLYPEAYTSDYYCIPTNDSLPIRWMAPEVIFYEKYTILSDVWSFGITLWELYSYGEQPFKSLNNQQVIESIRSRKLLACPNKCPSNIYNIMKNCWNDKCDDRPTFDKLYAQLVSLQSNEVLQFSSARKLPTNHQFV